MAKSKKALKYNKVMFVEMKYQTKSHYPEDIKKDNSFFLADYRRQIPLDILFPATILEKKGLKCKVVDLNYSSLEQLKKEIDSFNPQIIFISTAYMCYWQCPPEPVLLKENVEQIRNLFKGPIGIFGPHSTTMPEEILKRSKADFVIRGEPEVSITTICKSGFKNAPSVSYSLKNKKIKHNPFAAPQDLKKMPIPDYNLIDTLIYPEAIIQSSRGCPAHCIFCNKTMYGQGYRERKLQDIIKEIRLLKNKGFTEIYFQDLEFFFNNERMQKFCKLLINSNLKINWSCTARVNSIKDLTTFRLMKKSGCTIINFGLESAAKEVLNKSGKNITLEEVETSMSLCEKSGIIGAYNIIFGLPGENRKTMMETIKFIGKNYGRKNIKIDRGFRVIYFPGSVLFKKGIKDGTITKENLYNDIYYKSGTLGTDFNTKEEFDKAFQKARISLFLTKKAKKIKKLILGKE
ncbi:MAG: radical SAM protein [archaeon]|jgi:radical SAM superfamily enzyme YgiQ (UPF0313 family)